MRGRVCKRECECVGVKLDERRDVSKGLTRGPPDPGEDSPLEVTSSKDPPATSKKSLETTPAKGMTICKAGAHRRRHFLKMESCDGEAPCAKG